MRTGVGVLTCQVGFIIALEPLGVLLGCVTSVSFLQRIIAPKALVIGCFLAQAAFSSVFALAGLWSPSASVAFIAHACIARIALGVSYGVTMPTVQYIAISYTPHSKLRIILATIGMSRQLGMVLGPLLGGLFYDMGGFPAPLLFGSFASLLVAGITPYCFARLEHEPKARSDLVTFSQILRVPNFSVVVSLTFLIVAVRVTRLPLLE